MKITFCGAARIVTGSCYLLETAGQKVLIDCGMFQGTKDITRLNYLPFKFDPKSISNVILTHAHIDHSGLIPKLVAEGFRGRVLGTAATVDLCAIMLEDSAHVQERDTESENRRRLREGQEPRQPLFTMQNAQDSMNFFEGFGYNKTINVTDNIKVVFRDAGHILGSSVAEVYVTEKGKSTKIVFSGDIGQWNAPIVKDPTLIADADFLLIESTYGDRLHRAGKDRDEQLLDVVNSTFKKGGRLMIPAFSVERTQELLYSFKKLINKGLFPKQKIFLDSPLAIKATEIFMNHRECFDSEALKVFKGFEDIPQLKFCPTAQDSMKINEHKQPCIIMAGSGMCNAGRIRHHLKHGLWDTRNTVLFVGYQAAGTLGRVISDGAKEVKMMGMTVVVRADIHKIDGFSAHADAGELMKWAGGFRQKPRKTFVVHGEPQAAEALRARLSDEGFATQVPTLGEAVVLM